MKKLSLVACGLLVSTVSVFADSSTLKEAFAKGTTSGDITVYSQHSDNKGGTLDSGYTSGSVGITYETDSLNGFNAKIGFRGNHELSEKEDGDYSSNYANNASITEANVKYEDDNFALIFGRQAIDLEWLGDYNDAVVGVVKAIPNTAIVVGYTNRQAEIGIDTDNKFEEITKDGAYVVDVKYEGIENVVLNPYVYSAPDVADFYGAKVSYDNDLFGVTAHYAASSEDTQEDGDFYNLEARLNLAGVALAAGLFQTDKTVGAGSISAYGDQNPFDEGTNVYEADATTYYGSASYTIADLTLTALYGSTEYGTANATTDELNLIAEYSFTEAISGNITYVDYDDQANSDDFKKVFANVTYSF
ncbi:MAG: Opr family porin [Candidatus Marinarcus sp.]|uniref:Opr family porin n=1 Tax=Candidatus Marinarcus sp. TaxID=3100987 RepID=UPI003AFF9A97